MLANIDVILVKKKEVHLRDSMFFVIVVFVPLTVLQKYSCSQFVL